MSRRLLSENHNEQPMGVCGKVKRLVFVWWDGLAMFSYAGGNYKLNRTKQNKDPSFLDRIKDL